MKDQIRMSLRRAPVGGAPVTGVMMALLLLVSNQTACADERLFTYSYEADYLPKGEWEFEQWLTHRRGRAGSTFSAWDFREELEFGLTDRLTAALYLNFKSQTAAAESEFEFEGISSEWKYQVLNPNTKPIGLALYFEPTYNGTEVEVEEKLILQKNFGKRWTAVLNATVEQEWAREAGRTETETALEFTAGVAFRLSPRWSVGLEGRNHREFIDNIGFENQDHSAWFVGPNLHYAGKGWWGTLTVLPQVHGSPDTSGGLHLVEHEKLEIRLIVGKSF